MPANIQQLRTSLPSTNVWQNLNTQAAAAAGAQNAHQTGNHELPGVHPSGQSWHAFTSSKNQHQPYVQHLNQSINGLHEFIHKHAASGPQKRKALTNVQNFSTTKINCKPAALTPMMVNENRRNLHLIAQQLKNDAIPLEQRVGLALALTEGLNVCNEGATLNIQSCASELINQQQGLAGIVVGLKNQLIDQQLLQLVKHVDARQLSPAMAEAFEIHHVQALKNHVAGQWGLTAIEDRYATDQYQHHFKNIGLVPKDASASFILSEKTISTQQAIEQTSHLLGAPPVRQMAFNASFWFGHTLNSSQQEKEDEERKKTQRHHTSA